MADELNNSTDPAENVHEKAFLDYLDRKEASYNEGCQQLAKRQKPVGDSSNTADGEGSEPESSPKDDQPNE